MNKGSVSIFITIALSIWAVMHAFVFWRLASVPWIGGRLSGGTLLVAAIGLWISFPLARILQAKRLDVVALPVEIVASNWLGILFLLFAALLVAEVLTLGGWLFPGIAPAIRSWAVVVALGLSVFALIQGARAPVLREYEVRLQGLPAADDGLSLIQISDLHLGTMTSQRWTKRLVARINNLRPDAIVVVGDLVDGDVERVTPHLSLLKALHAPLGVWAVMGNHEAYAGTDESVRLHEAAGYRVLRDQWAEVKPGLVMAGVDDLTTRLPVGDRGKLVETALANRPAGATILLSHSPLQVETAAVGGVSLMLSGHTHGGQIWPFNYLVGLKYPLRSGRYEVRQMTVIVCRGTGTWGPQMRLWRPSEIVRITLRRGHD